MAKQKKPAKKPAKKTSKPSAKVAKKASRKPAKKAVAKKQATRKPVKSTKPQKPAKAKPVKSTKPRKPAKAKPTKLAYKPLGTVPTLELQTVAERAFDIVYQPSKPRALATASKILTGHSQFVQGLVFSPDGTQLVSGSEDGTIKVWNVADGSCLRTLTDHSSAVNGVSFTADGKYLLSASDDYTVKVWSVPAYEVVRSLEGHTDYVSKVFPAGPGRALSSGKDGMLRLWNLETGDCLRVMDHGGWVFALGVSHDGKRALASSDHNVMRIWDLETGEIERVLLDASSGYIGEIMGMTMSADNTTGIGHRSYPKKLVFSPDDASFLSSEAELIEWDTATGTELGRTEGDGWALEGIAYLPDRASMLRAHGDPMEHAFIDQLERAPGDREARSVYGDWLEDHGRLAEANSVRRHGAFRYVFAGSRDAVHVIDLGLRAIVAQASWPCDGDVHNVAVSPDGRFGASGSHDGIVGLWDLDALLRAGMPDRHLSRPSELAISQDGIALTASSDRTARLWNANGTRNERLPPPAGLFNVVRFTPDGRLALVMSDKGSIQIFDAKTAELRGISRYDEDGHHPFSEVAFLRDGRALVGATTGPLAIFPLDPPGAPVVFDAEAGQVTGLAIDEDADLVVTVEYASGKEPMRVKYWSLSARKLTRELAFKAGDGEYATSVSIVDGGARTAITTSAGGLAILDRDGAVVRAIKLSDGYLNEVMMLPDGTLVVANNGDPLLVDVRKAAVVSRTDWTTTQLSFIAGTSRAVTNTGGVGLVDFATRTLWPVTPVSASNNLRASPDGTFAITTSIDDELAGSPIVLRLR